MESSRFDPYVFKQALEKCEFPSSVVITFQVMAVSGMSPGYPYPVRAVPESGKYELGAYTAGTGDPYYPEI